MNAADAAVILGSSALIGTGIAAAGIAVSRAVADAVKSLGFQGYALTVSLRPPPKPKEPVPAEPAVTVPAAANGRAAAPARIKEAA